MTVQDYVNDILNNHIENTIQPFIDSLNNSTKTEFAYCYENCKIEIYVNFTKFMNQYLNYSTDFTRDNLVLPIIDYYLYNKHLDIPSFNKLFYIVFSNKRTFNEILQIFKNDSYIKYWYIIDYEDYFKTINYVPEAKRQDTVFTFTSQILDYLLLRTLDRPKEYELNALIERLLKQYTDKEAVLSYYNKFIRPILGSRHALENLFDLLELEVRLIEWHESYLPIRPFWFIEELQVYKESLNIDDLIDLTNMVKNERSKLVRIKMPECPDMIYLDYTFLDRDILSTFPAIMYKGVNICLYEKHPSLIQLEGLNLFNIQNTIRSQIYTEGFIWDWDYYDYTYFKPVTLSGGEVIQTTVGGDPLARQWTGYWVGTWQDQYTIDADSNHITI